MTEKKFIQVFSRRKKAFLQDVEKGRMPKASTGPDGQYDHKKVLDWFEKWLKEENVLPQKSQPVTSKSFEGFIEEVLCEVKNILSQKNINIIYSLPGQSLGINESWKCVKVFNKTDVYYRIGRTRPRKGPNRGQELLVLDLVMDGYKKNVFLPLLELKSEIEKKLGSELERELPKVEATGKYRLKILLPIESVQGDIAHTANRFADFIAITKPILNQLGIS